MYGLRGQLAVQVPAVQHVEQARNLELFKSKHNMGVKYVLEYHRGAVTPGPVQVSTFIQSYEIKSPPWTILWFRILGIFSVESIKRLCVFIFQT